MMYQIIRIGDGHESWELPDDLTDKKHPSREAAIEAAKEFIFDELPSADYGAEEGATSIELRIVIAIAGEDDGKEFRFNFELESPDRGSDCDHDWVHDESQGSGGTTMIHYSHCDICGRLRKEINFGGQRNPDQQDQVEYSWPEGHADDE